MSMLKRGIHGVKPITPAERTQELSRSIQGQIDATPASLRSLVDALRLEPLGHGLSTQSSLLQKQSDSLKEAAAVRDQASAAALKAQACITNENRTNLLPITMRAAVAAEACAAAEIEASSNFSWRLDSLAMRPVIPPVLQAEEKNKKQSSYKNVGPWREQLQPPTRPRSVSPVKSSFDWHPFDTVNKYDDLWSSMSTIGKPAPAKPSFMSKRQEIPASHAVDFYSDRTQLINARSEVKRLMFKLKEANEEVRRLQHDELELIHDSQRLVKAHQEEERSMHDVDSRMLAHKLRSRTQVGHVPHSAVDMAAKIMGGEFARLGKEESDWKAAPRTFKNESRDWELSMAKQDTFVDHRYLDSKASWGTRRAEASLY